MIAAITDIGIRSTGVIPGEKGIYTVPRFWWRGTGGGVACKKYIPHFSRKTIFKINQLLTIFDKINITDSYSSYTVFFKMLVTKTLN